MNGIVKRVNFADVQKLFANLPESDKMTLAIGAIAGTIYLVDKAINTVETLAIKTIENKGSVSLSKNGFNFTPAGATTT